MTWKHWLLAAVAIGGCSDRGPVSTVAQNVVARNGVSLNGVSLNGVSLNGVSLNGVSLNGVSLNGVSLNGVSLNGVSLNGTVLTGYASGTAVSGTGFVGATFWATLSTDGSLRMRIDSIRRGEKTLKDVYYYGISYQTSAGWTPLCGLNSSGTPIEAIPLVGLWNQHGTWNSDTSTVTFGCLGFALAKCVELGYKPWNIVNGHDYAKYHQTCTRLLRADYCGDGTSNTVDGTLVNLYDGIGVQSDDQGWPFEAEWYEDGARCIKSLRYDDRVPPCYEDKLDSDCGEGFSSSTLLMSEVQ